MRKGRTLGPWGEGKGSRWASVCFQRQRSSHRCPWNHPAKRNIFKTVSLHTLEACLLGRGKHTPRAMWNTKSAVYPTSWLCITWGFSGISKNLLFGKLADYDHPTGEKSETNKLEGQEVFTWLPHELHWPSLPMPSWSISIVLLIVIYMTRKQNQY